MTQATADALSTRIDNGKLAANGDFSGYKVPVVWSPMLTVWRKLHVEVDSMGPVDWSAANSETSNAQSGTVQRPPTFNSSNNRAVVDIADLHPDFEETDQHKVGKMIINGYGVFTTIATETSWGDDQVTIINAPASIVNANGATYLLHDDDVGSDPNGKPPFIMVGFDAPPVTLPKVPDTGLMAQVFRNAYVDVAPLDMQYYDANTAFDRNVATNGEAVGSGNENRDLTSSAEFWAVHVTSAFQGYVAKDGDPDGEQAASGLQYGLTGDPPFTFGRRAGSLVFLETIRDDKRGNSANMAILERYTAVHETGHQFLLEHADDRSPPGDQQDPSGDFIMTDVLDQTGMAPNIAFSPVSLKKIRSIEYPPQP